MAKYVDEFESLFSQLELLGKDTKVAETYNAPILLATMESTTQGNRRPYLGFGHGGPHPGVEALCL